MHQKKVAEVDHLTRIHASYDDTFGSLWEGSASNSCLKLAIKALGAMPPTLSISSLVMSS